MSIPKKLFAAKNLPILQLTVSIGPFFNEVKTVISSLSDAELGEQLEVLGEQWNLIERHHQDLGILRGALAREITRRLSGEPVASLDPPAPKTLSTHSPEPRLTWTLKEGSKEFWTSSLKLWHSDCDASIYPAAKGSHWILSVRTLGSTYERFATNLELAKADAECLCLNPSFLHSHFSRGT